MVRRKTGALLGLALAGVVLLMAAPFALRAVGLGLGGISGNLWPEVRFDAPDATLSAAIFLHMISGGLITLLAPIQLVPSIRRRRPVAHRVLGRVVAGLAALTAVNGLAWIASEGTIGGAHMSVAFACYGLAMGAAAIQTIRYARARQRARHRRWALRLAVLALGSWFYRVHYAFWYAVTGGAWSTPDFTGVFDRVQVWAFFVPYLLLLEVWFLRERILARKAQSRSSEGLPLESL